MFSIGDRVRLEARVVRVTGEMVALQLADGQAVQTSAAHLHSVETKALRSSERKVAHGEDDISE